MHEMSIAQSILDIVKEEMAKHGVKELKAINIAVGKLSAIVPSSLSFCFKILTDQSNMEGVQLKSNAVNLLFYRTGIGIT